MAYVLENETQRHILTCEKKLWHRAIAAARAAGWEPEGTRYDYTFEVDRVFDPMVDYLYNLWMIFHVNREFHEWDGGYGEKNNQIVSESDAYYFMKALEKAGGDEYQSLIEFLQGGSFRICGEQAPLNGNWG